MPKQNICNPPIKVIMQTNDGQPAVGSWNTIVLIIIRIIKNSETNNISIPTKDTTANGTVEKATIPSIA